MFAATPVALHPLRNDQPVNRLGLARWLVDENNPLVARVAVNRLWEQIFGRGLVETSEDFGTQGAPPTHPELLDWLATEFIAKGWSQKALIRTIVLSATYRQTSAVTPELAERDPYNRLFARGPRVRMEAEMVRDTALAVSGLLSREDVRPERVSPQPDGIWNMPYNSRQVDDEHGRGSLSAQRVYVLAPHVAVSEPHHLRRDEPGALHGASRPHEHAAPGADAPQRSGLVRGRRRTGQADDRRPCRAGGARQEHRAESGRASPSASSWSSRARQSPPSSIGCVAVRRELAHYRARGSADSAELQAWTMVANVLLNLDEAVTKGVSASRAALGRAVQRGRKARCERGWGPREQAK